MKLKLKQLDYHRNGVAGRGFYVAIVEDRSDGEPREMLVVRFPKEADSSDGGGILCAAFDLAKLDKRDIRFFHNSFRGDNFADAMDKFIKNYPDGLHADYKIPTEQLAGAEEIVDA